MKDKDQHEAHAPEHKAREHKAPEHGEKPKAAAPSELDALKDRLLRLQADFENFRKRTARERAEQAERAAEDLVAELLPVIDHFELGLRSAAEHQADPAVLSGFQLVFDQLMEVLRKAGVSVVDAAGQPFDPSVHEAVSHLPSAEHPADTVIAQNRRGYRLGKKLLRAAQVVVSSGPPRGAAPESGQPAGETD